MRIYANTLAAIILTVTSTSTLAEWTLVDSNESFDSYVNFATIRRDGEKAKMWTMADYKARNGKPYLSDNTLVAFGCKDETLRVLSLTRFKKNMGLGEVTSIDNAPGEVAYVLPDSLGEKLLKIACGKK